MQPLPYTITCYSEQNTVRENEEETNDKLLDVSINGLMTGGSLHLQLLYL